MEISKLSDAEFKTLVIRMLKELSEDVSSIKKIQSEIKDRLIEINNLQGSTEEWMKPRIKSMIWNIRKRKTTIQNNKKKKESNSNKDSVRSLWENFKQSNIHIIGVPEGEEKEQENGNIYEKIVKENFPIW